MRVTFLGTGTSVGVPRIACDCPVCTSTQPENKRLRCSILIEHDDRHILVDTSPDLRTQALTYRVDRVDAVLFTHGHADHLHGLDDVRIYCFQRDEPLPCYGDAATLDRIRRVFDYAFDSPYRHALPQLELHEITGSFELFGLTIAPVTVFHGKMPVLGFRIGDFAYVTDCNQVPHPLHRRRSARGDRVRGSAPSPADTHRARTGAPRHQRCSSSPRAAGLRRTGARAIRKLPNKESAAA